MQIAHGANLKEIQVWLGRSDINTTANLYVHMDVSAKEQSAAIMSQYLMLNGPVNNEDSRNAS